MGNVSLAQHNFGWYPGTILAGGTLSGEMDISGHAVLGLIMRDSMTLGTLQFRVSSVSDAEGGVYVQVKDSGGSIVQLGPLSGAFALKGDDLAFLAPYRYVRIETTSTQANGLSFRMPVKA